MRSSTSTSTASCSQDPGQTGPELQEGSVMAHANLVPIPGSEKHPLALAEPIGDVHPEERIEVTVRVRARANAQLAGYVSDLASQTVDAREHLTREAFAEQFGADPADLARVAAFARRRGLAVVESSAARRS